MEWHWQTIESVFSALDSSPVGLSGGEAQRRLEVHGPNALPERKGPSVFRLLLRQFTDFMILILLGAAVVSMALQEWKDAIVILLIIVVNGIIGFYQEYNAEKALASLKKLAALYATVLRDGQHLLLDAEKLAPGDVVLLEAGNIVPADLRLVEEVALLVDESTLTGESRPVSKSAVPLDIPDLPLAERNNMLYKGTQVVAGKARAVVVATGLNTELGAIAQLLQESYTPTPLQIRLNDFGKKLSWVVLGICTILFAVGYLRGEAPMTLLLTVISLAVAAIPEALPAVVTIALARGAGLMVGRNALIRKLPAVESLGSVTYICTDKTGTLTQNRMTVLEVYAYEPEDGALAPTRLQTCMALNNDARMEADKPPFGDPTEIALLQYLRDKQLDPLALQRTAPRLTEIPFDSGRKRMTTVHAEGGRYRIWAKGGLEAILERCNPAKDYTEEKEVAEQWASRSLRVLAFATRVVDLLPPTDQMHLLEQELTLVGLVGMADPPRPEAASSVATCRNAGVQVVMITGDHPVTAAAIGKEIGLLTDSDRILSGQMLSRMDDAALAAEAPDIRVYARVSPEQKLDIVRALQENGQFVAMTGDGVNDAPALQKAHVGIAMGISGTDVSKDASDMVLLDDNFATIVAAIHEGRRIYDNILKFIRYILTGNAGEIWTIFLAPLIGMPIPLLPIHILWINLVTDGLPALALAAEPADPDVMQRPPRPPGHGLFADGLGYKVLWSGLFIAFVCLGIQAWALRTGGHGQTMVFTTLAFCQLFGVLAIRSPRFHLWQIGVFSNPGLVWSILLVMGLQLAIVYAPILQGVFRTEALTAYELAVCMGGALVVYLALELEKWGIRRAKQAN
ncbi:MAG: cation-translocating P-type ATPase [Saprospiraceae bacterium]|nr:cation-translocating P-type ATPase [Saprospiraceae bacterium]